MSTRLAIELDEELVSRLEAVAAREKMTVEALARDAVARAVLDLESWAEDDAAYAEYERTGEAIPLSAMENWAKSWGSPDELPPPKPCKSSS
jgi:predicted transcriptional regulator